MHSAIVSAVGCHHKTRTQNSMMHCFLSDALTYIHKKSYHGCWYIKDVVAVISCVYFLLGASRASKKATSAPIFYSALLAIYIMIIWRHTISAVLPPGALFALRKIYCRCTHRSIRGLYENLIIKFHRSIFYTFSRAAARVCAFSSNLSTPCMKHKFRPQQY